MKPNRVLIVEDEMISALDLGQRLRIEGYEICGLAPTGEEALENFEKQRPDIALIDINLRGGLSGIKTAQEIRSRFSIPVIFMTGYADAETRRDAEVVKPAGYFVKPLEIGKLIEAIESAVEKDR